MGVDIRVLGRFEAVVDGRHVAPDAWQRRHASALVKLLALAPGRQLHRERVLDALWPELTVEAAAPRLHKAAHYARRALERDDAVLLRADVVALLPGAEVEVDVDRFRSLSAAARSSRDPKDVTAALDAYGGELLPGDLYEAWVEIDRDALRSDHRELLRLGGRWADLVAADPSDEQAHVQLMRLHARAGDRRAALRQYERLDRALRQELGVGPSAAATTLRDQLLAAEGSAAEPDDDDDVVGREREVRLVDAALAGAARGSGTTVLLSGAAGSGKTTLLERALGRAAARGWRTGRGSAAQVEGAWPYAPVLEALSDLCRQHPILLDGLADEHRASIERALALQDLPWQPDGGHQRLFVASTELLRLAAAGPGAVLLLDDLHEADEASLRLLHHWSRACSGERLVLLLAFRDEQGGAALEQVRTSLLGRGAATQVTLGPLDAASVRDLVERQVRAPDDQLVEQVRILSGGLPFAVVELARSAAERPGELGPLVAVVTSRLSPAVRDVLVRVAVAGAVFDTDEFLALSGLPDGEAYQLLDEALASGALQPTAAGLRFRHALLRESLLEQLPAHRRRQLHRDAAARLEGLDAPPVRVGHHLVAGGRPEAAVPFLLSAARTEAAVGAYRDALGLLDAVRGSVADTDAGALHSLRGDLLAALGEPEALHAYREASRRTTGEAQRHARAGLARAAVTAGDLETAAVALDGLELDGGPSDPAILLARGNLAYFSGDVDQAWEVTRQARALLVTAQSDWQVLDLIGLQGLIAHQRGEWFERLSTELKTTRDAPRLVTAVFDANLCVAEYLLYGPTPYAEVVELARSIRATAERAGALRAVAFADALVGEAALLAGDLDLAETSLREAVDLHHEIGARAGEAHSLQRLAEVRVARGDRTEARALLQRALPLARWSAIGMHLLQRIHGTMIAAAPDPTSARAVVDAAVASTGQEDECHFCAVMFAVPAAIACAEVGDVAAAQEHLARAERSTALWSGTAWQAATLEARGHLTRAEGNASAAAAALASAAELFQQSGQPLDAERCRRAAAGAGVPAARPSLDPGRLPV